MAAFRPTMLEMAARLSDPEFWTAYRQSVVATMSTFSDPHFWKSFRAQWITLGATLSDPNFQAAFQSQILAMAARDRAYTDAVRQALEEFARQVSEPALAAAIQQRLADEWDEQAGVAGRDGRFPLVLFANLVFTCVLIWSLGYFLGEVNRTGEDLSEVNRFELASSVGFAVSIALGARAAILRGGKRLGM